LILLKWSGYVLRLRYNGIQAFYEKLDNIRWTFNKLTCYPQIGVMLHPVIGHSSKFQMKQFLFFCSTILNNIWSMKISFGKIVSLQKLIILYVLRYIFIKSGFQIEHYRIVWLLLLYCLSLEKVLRTFWIQYIGLWNRIFMHCF
jgi:hypothetical protein